MKWPFADVLLKALPLKEYARCYRFFQAEPWGNVGLGHTIGRLAQATSEAQGIAPEDFVVATPTPAEAKEREEFEQQKAEFDAWI